MTILNHYNLTDFINEYFKHNKDVKDFDGLCYGFSTKYIDSYLLQDRQTLYRRLKVLSDYNKDVTSLFKEIDALRKRIKAGEIFENLSQYEQDLLEIPAYFESISILQSPDRFLKPLELYFTSSNQNYSQFFQFSKSKKIADKEIKNNFSTCHMLTKHGLVNYFKKLKIYIKRKNLESGFLLEAGRHATSVIFNKKQNSWQFIDINRLYEGDQKTMVLTLKKLFGPIPKSRKKRQIYYENAGNYPDKFKQMYAKIQSEIDEKVFHSNHKTEQSLVDEIFDSHHEASSSHMGIRISSFSLSTNSAKHTFSDLIQTNRFYSLYKDHIITFLKVEYLSIFIGALTLSLNFMVSALTAFSITLILVYLEDGTSALERIYDFVANEKIDNIENQQDPGPDHECSINYLA